MFVEVEMLVHCNTKQVFSSSFFKLDFMIGKYLIFTDFFKAHEFTFTLTIALEPVLSNILELSGNFCYKHIQCYH